MADQFSLTINIMLAIYTVITTTIFFFTWRKRPDLIYWFIALIIYSLGHTLLIFRQLNILFTYLGNAVQLIALIIVVVTTYIEYVTIMIKSQQDNNRVKKEKRFLVITIAISFLSGILSIILFWWYSLLDILTPIVISMIVFLIPLTIFVMRIYQKQKTITRLFMFYVFFAGTVTAFSTILSLHSDWGTAMNDAMNFVFITLILTGGLAALAEQRITSSEEKYKTLSENLEVKVVERTKQLEEAYEELEAFSYTVSHDLRAPLRSIIGFSEILQDECSNILDEKGREHLERILKSSNRMDELINDLLELSRVSRIDMNFENVNLSNISSEIMDDLNSLYPDSNLEFYIQQNVIAIGDLNLIRIVLENLLNNAVKFSMKKSQPLIEFGTREESGKTVFFVKDNGIGFYMKHYDKLFALFQRLHSSKDYEGTGIGLITVKRIVERHKGKIWAEGEINKGAIFYFTLDE
ncbi:MAG: GHKL domain-containing protein [Asgard group archaeon]|nr:GHKL domain-containing protein [Asgard group archaeon]